MTLEATAIFFCVLLAMVYVEPLSLKRVSVAVVALAGWYITRDLSVALVPTFFAIIAGCAINAWCKVYKQYYTEELCREYERTIRALPDFVEVPTDSKKHYAFIIKEGEYACKVFHVERVGRTEAECRFADLIDNEMMDLTIDEGAKKLMDDFTFFVIVRAELGLEDNAK